MVSKIFLLIVFTLATVLLLTSEIAGARELASNHGHVVEDANHGFEHDKHEHYEYEDDDHDHHHRRHHRHHDHDDDDYDHDYYDHDHHDNDNDWYNYGGRHYCRHGCCGDGGYYDGGCKCCTTLAEATIYKQVHKAQTHN
ncbi:hypothetical protein R6Q59_019178 [Mikania micrantha]|uniref:Glycine-rich protein n=1 Tax=Mikania micrantha TaxID=192012 RepID=A0A5N6LY77_9ASTR|nr:hypothetical protein E3N88_34465 [Mikania micrantha]